MSCDRNDGESAKTERGDAVSEVSARQRETRLTGRVRVGIPMHGDLARIGFGSRSGRVERETGRSGPARRGRETMRDRPSGSAMIGARASGACPGPGAYPAPGVRFAVYSALRAESGPGPSPPGGRVAGAGTQLGRWGPDRERGTFARPHPSRLVSRLLTGRGRCCVLSRVERCHGREVGT